MKKIRNIFIVVLGLVIGVAGCAKTPVSSSLTGPEKVVTSFLQAAGEGDVEECLTYFTDDIVLRQEPQGTRIEGKTQLETGLRQMVLWHHTFSVVGSMQTEGDRVTFTIHETADEYKIMGLEYITGDMEMEVFDGKIKTWTATVKSSDLKKIAELSAGGVGFKFETAAAGLRITEFAKNSPLIGTGVRTGDLIIAVDGVSFSQMREGEMQLRIKGPVGSKVKLTVTHEGAAAATDIEVVRVDLQQLSY